MSVAWVACMTDTHATVGEPTDTLTKLSAWIAANRVGRNIVAVFHRGDFSVGPTAGEWAKVSASGFPVAGIPNVWLPGNHDSDVVATRVHTTYLAALPSSGMSALAGEYAAGSSVNTYHLIDIGGRTWLVFALEMNPPDAVVTWMDGILAANATTPAIVLTHSDLYRDGTLTDATLGTQDYVYTGFSGGDNYGQQLWDKSLEARGNVALVMSGHDVTNVSAYLATTRPAGAMFTTCHHVVRNWQSYRAENSGNPFLTMVGFDYVSNKFYFDEFSPSSIENKWLPTSCFRAQMFG